MASIDVIADSGHMAGEGTNVDVSSQLTFSMAKISLKDDQVLPSSVRRVACMISWEFRYKVCHREDISAHVL